MPCRNTPVRKDNVQICLVCRKPIIADGEETENLNRGGKRGVRHASCGQSVSSCPYYEVGHWKQLKCHLQPAKRSCFQETVGEGASVLPRPCSPTVSGNESPRDPRLRRNM